MASPLDIIFEMIMLVLSNTMSTVGTVFSLFLDLMTSLLRNGSALGTTGLLMALGIAALVTFFVAKFFISSWKMAVVLFIAAFLILFALGAVII